MSAVAELVLVQGDITRRRVDVVVNAANRRMRGGGGVDAARLAVATLATTPVLAVGRIEIVVLGDRERDAVRAALDALPPVGSSQAPAAPPREGATTRDEGTTP